MLITLDPTGARHSDTTTRRVAPRKPLTGARVGLVSNGLGRTEDLLWEAYRLLKESAGVGDAFLIRKPSDRRLRCPRTGTSC
jgi:hypothetical protein